MPKVKELKAQYKENEIGRIMEKHRAYRDMSQDELAEQIGMTQQNYSHKARKNKFNYIDLLRLFKALELSDEEILRVMKL